MASENEAVTNVLSETELMKTVLADLRSSEINIPVEMKLSNVSRPLIHRHKSLPNIAINFGQSIAAAGDADNRSSSAVPTEGPPAEICNLVSHINPASETTNSTVLSDVEILRLREQLANPPKYHKICVANYAGPEFQRYMALVDKIVNSPLETESEVDTSASFPVLETPIKSSDVQAAQASQDIADRWVVRRCSSMPNIHIRFGVADVNLEQKTCDGSSEERQATGADDMQPKRRKSVWSRTKRFVRRLFCCIA